MSTKKSIKSKIFAKLIISIMILAVSIAFAGTSTYAWFSLSSTPTVGTFDLTVTTRDGLFIALDKDLDYAIQDSEYATTVSAADIATYLTAQYGARTLTHATIPSRISSEDPLASQNMPTASFANKDFLGDQLEIHSQLAQEDKATQTKSYSFRFFFRSTSAMTITLSNNSKVSSKVPATWPDADLEDNLKYVTAPNTTTDYAYAKDLRNTTLDTKYGASTVYRFTSTEEKVFARAENAVRIAFRGSSQVDGNNRWWPYNASGITYGALSTQLWDPNKGKGWGDGTYGSGVLSGNLAFDILKKDMPSLTQQRAVVGDSVTPTNGAVAGTTLLVLQNNVDNGFYEGFISVTIYLEGYDGNAFNSLLGDIISTDLQFAGLI
ncbi:MAG: hypothetical protein LBU04_05665 [Christensenellaceae bacterium]|nr:hypothetical protein [Christensenellaceae bacterium]